MQDERLAIRRYWDAHPIATDSVAAERGSPESFAAIRASWERGLDDARRDFLAHCRGKRVLEIGCGIAMDGRWLAEHGIDYQAVDLSRQSLRLARRHFELFSLPARFTNADAPRLPFADGTFDVVFSIGVLHHVPEMERACREAVRVLRPGGTLRVMFYARRSYHYALVRYVVAPLLWLLLRIPGGDRLASRPAKLRSLYAISRRHGWSVQRILAASTDTSEAGDDAANPHSAFVTEHDLRGLFPDIGGHRFHRSVLRYFPPLPWRGAIERRWGFFLTMSGTRY